MEDRVARILSDYAPFVGDLDAVGNALFRLPRHLSKVQRTDWLALATAGCLQARAATGRAGALQ